MKTKKKDKRTLSDEGILATFKKFVVFLNIYMNKMEKMTKNEKKKKLNLKCVCFRSVYLSVYLNGNFLLFTLNGSMVTVTWWKKIYEPFQMWTHLLASTVTASTPLQFHMCVENEMKKTLSYLTFTLSLFVVVLILWISSIFMEYECALMHALFVWRESYFNMIIESFLYPRGPIWYFIYRKQEQKTKSTLWSQCKPNWEWERERYNMYMCVKWCLKANIYLFLLEIEG